MEGATVKLNRSGAFLEVMRLTAVIIAPTQAQRSRASVDAVSQIVGNRPTKEMLSKATILERHRARFALFCSAGAR
jgi:hypothetical protein